MFNLFRCFVGLAVLCVASAFAEVTVAPSEITVMSPDDSFSIALTADGQPLPAGDVTGLKVMVQSHDYDEMFSYTAKDGTVTIRPTARLEIGSYDLVIHTKHGKVTVFADAPLGDLESVLDMQARAQGMTLAEYRQLMDIVDQPGRAAIEITIPSVYYLGQTISVPMKDTGSARSFTWSVNGDAVQEGVGPHTFSYMPLEAGPYFITYRESQEGEIVVEDSNLVRIATEPPVPYKIKPNLETTFTGPDGYDHYEWSVDGRVTSKTKNLDISFKQNSAVVLLSCRAYSKEGDKVTKLRQISYAVEVGR